MREITVDIDRPFIGFLKFEREAMQEKIKRVPWAAEACIRPSSNGNTHIKIKMASEVGFLDSLCIRAYLGDDPNRITFDLRRYFYERNEGKTGRLFDEKYSDGKLRVSGAWRPL
jgi:hypothetical protein